MTFGELLKKRRKELELSQRDVASMFGMSHVTVSLYESGRAFPSIDRAEYIVKRLGGRMVFEVE